MGRGTCLERFHHGPVLDCVGVDNALQRNEAVPHQEYDGDGNDDNDDDAVVVAAAVVHVLTDEYRRFGCCRDAGGDDRHCDLYGCCWQSWKPPPCSEHARPMYDKDFQLDRDFHVHVLHPRKITTRKRMHAPYHPSSL